MLSNKEIICPDNLLNVAHKKRGVKAAIVNAGKPLPMLSVQDAVNENLIEPVFIGDKKEILKCAENLKWDISNYEIIDEPTENNTAAIIVITDSTKQNRVVFSWKINEKGHLILEEISEQSQVRLGDTAYWIFDDDKLVPYDIKEDINKGMVLIKVK